VITAYSIALAAACLVKYGDTWFWMAITATICFQQHAMIFDKIKIVYTLQMKPKTDAASVEFQEVTDLKLLRSRYEALPAGVEKVLMKLACVYSEGLGIDPKLCAPGKLVGNAEQGPKCAGVMRLTTFLGTGTGTFLWYCLMLAYPFAPDALLKSFVVFHLTLWNVLHVYCRNLAIEHGLYHGDWSELQAVTYFYALGAVVYFTTKAIIAQ
jgi:hypothetical protein